MVGDSGGEVRTGSPASIVSREEILDHGRSIQKDFCHMEKPSNETTWVQCPELFEPACHRSKTLSQWIMMLLEN
jgi:hypothetical protein